MNVTPLLGDFGGRGGIFIFYRALLPLECSTLSLFVGEREREGSTKGKRRLYKLLQIPTLPPKWPRSGVTFHYEKLWDHLGERRKLDVRLTKLL